jgi:predicted RNase H-like HicB family nuclease
VTRELEYAVIVYEAEEGGFWTEVPSLPGAGSQGESIEEALARTKESIQLVLEVMKEEGRQIQAPREVVMSVKVAA